MEYSADIKKKKKSDVLGVKTMENGMHPVAHEMEESEVEKAKEYGVGGVPKSVGIKSSGVLGAMLDAKLGKKPEDVNAVTEVDGGKVEWKAGSNAAAEEAIIKKKYEEKLKKLKAGK